MDILNIVLRIAAVLLIINVGKFISKRIEDRRWWQNKEKNKRKEEEKYIKKQNRIQRGEFSIRAPGEYNIIGFIFMAVGIGFMIFSYFMHRYNMSVSPDGDDITGLIICIFIFALIFIFGLILVLYKYVWHINFNEQEIEYRRFFGIKSHYKFSDITKCVEHYGMEYRLFVYVDGKKKFSVDAMADGDALQFEDFIKEKRIPTDKVETKWYKRQQRKNNLH